MKTSNLLLAASLAANAVLVGGFLLGARDRAPSAALPSTESTAVAATIARSGSGASPATGEEWAALHTEDLAAERDRLRAEGFPAAFIRSIISAELRETFSAQRKALEAARGEIPFWKPQTLDPKTLSELRALDREAEQTLTTLLGPDPENGRAAMLQRQFPDLAAAKIAQLASIRESYDQRRSDLYATQGTGPLMGTSVVEREKIAAMDAAMHAEIAGILTPQELEDYDLRTSNTANQLRYNLTAFDATEQEFRTLYQLQQAFNDRMGVNSGPMTADQAKARNDAQNELNDQIKAAFGDDRFAEYKRATDYNYQQTSRLVTRLGLTSDTTNQLWAMQQDIQQRATALRTDRTLTPAARTQQLATLNDEATTKVTAALGEQGFAAYKLYGGSWLQTLQPPRPAPAQAGIPGTAR